MEMILEGSNSAETSPPWGGVARTHRPVTGKLATWLDNYISLLFVLFSPITPPSCCLLFILAIHQYLLSLMPTSPKSFYFLTTSACFLPSVFFPC
ncbi:hypothetical protein BDV37DRAFT_262562 [Aspergillus pseudonomiae]|uniref:Uncharacterized protein n=1 Tax=Aspergillus pseudonomiae TaxID=1506151 RepID=A0A5N7CX70_9EURO|nr:uncharacterized protein BDV37DRAFT_262562 [Aspergillus pseudonomiae]KAE8398761.1 hypothetical protein BDV37DRAFT_262562 [Aspergillus pseudonomiae]